MTQFGVKYNISAYKRGDVPWHTVLSEHREEWEAIAAVACDTSDNVYVLWIVDQNGHIWVHSVWRNGVCKYNNPELV